eukprot:12346803-Alexandrium_andersonii.AAC.1
MASRPYARHRGDRATHGLARTRGPSTKPSRPPRPRCRLPNGTDHVTSCSSASSPGPRGVPPTTDHPGLAPAKEAHAPVSYTHLRAHETSAHL